MTKEEFYKYLGKRLYESINPFAASDWDIIGDDAQRKYINAAKVAYSVVEARVSLYGDSSIDWD